LRKRIFDSGVSGKKGGWGVGLALTRRIVEDTFGGSIELARAQKGAEFVVKLPVMPPDGAA
jgi:nitrogen-specific signal transduction histidine kinase